MYAELLEQVAPEVVFGAVAVAVGPVEAANHAHGLEEQYGALPAVGGVVGPQELLDRRFRRLIE